MTVAFKPRYPKSPAARDADAQRSRHDARAKVLSRPMPRTCVVVGGKGVFRRLADSLAALVGDDIVEAGPALETLERILVRSLGTPPRVVIIAPAREAIPLLAELARWSATRTWPAPVDLLVGLRSRDRESFLRQAIKTARARVS